MKAPLVAQIKRNSLDDGPGIRSTVFFKGCPLSCVWCHNPECIGHETDLLYRQERCIACFTCREVCPAAAIGAEGPAGLDRAVCDLCGECAAECPAEGLEMVGTRYGPGELCDILLQDKVFYKNSGGGVTLSGGEPVLYTEYVGELARLLSERGVHVMIETCGDFDWERYEEHLAPYLSLIYVDLKLFDPEEHRRYCGKDNRRILSNIERMTRNGGPPALVRIPLIPEITATEENLAAIAAFLRGLGQRRVGVIPYNPLWMTKARGLGREFGFEREQWLSEAERARYRRALEGLEIVGDL